MFRRWLIRGSFTGLLLLLVAGWGVSTGRRLGCLYCHNKNAVACIVIWGEVDFCWQRGWNVPDGWDAFCEARSFRIVPSDVFWLNTSTTELGYTRWRLHCMGFDYDHYADGLLSGPRRERRIVAVPFWFLILVTGAGLVYAWRKTRPKLDPRRAFPVEIRGTRNNEH